MTTQLKLNRPVEFVAQVATLARILHKGDTYGESNLDYFDAHLTPVMGRLLVDTKLHPDRRLLAVVVGALHDSIEDGKVNGLGLYHSLSSHLEANKEDNGMVAEVVVAAVEALARQKDRESYEMYITRLCAIDYSEMADLVLAVKEADLLSSLAHEMPGILTEVLDVCDGKAIAALAQRLPALDVLFNCAGIVPNGSVLQCSEADWDGAFDLNVKSMYRMMKAFLPAMLERAKITDGASIINMASMASSIKGFPNRFAYGATKAAVIGMTKAIAADYVKMGLRCNALCPGTVDTPSLRQRIASAPDPVEAEKNFLARQPMGRLATAEEIAPMVVYLASNESRMVTGQAVPVDGGVTI